MAINQKEIIPILRGNGSSSATNGQTGQNAAFYVGLKASDPFLFYSIHENLQNAMNLEPINFSNDGARLSASIIRKTRISFEKDLLSVLTEDMLYEYE